MEGKVLGIPLAILVFIVLLGIIIGIPMLLFHNKQMNELQGINARLDSYIQVLRPTVTPIPTVEPTATPSSTLTPRVIRSTATPTPTE